MQEVSTVCVYPSLENGWTGYEQLAGSQYSSTKRAEIEILSCMCGYHVYKARQEAAVRELWHALKSPTNASVRHALAVINRRIERPLPAYMYQIVKLKRRKFFVSQ